MRKAQITLVHELWREALWTVAPLETGTAKDTTTIPITPGALLLFGGRKLLHRVTGVEGSRTRYITTLCYRDRPGVTNSPAVRELFYGRSEPLTPVAAH